MSMMLNPHRFGVTAAGTDGVLVTMTADLTFGVSLNDITWDAETYDPDGYHSLASNTERLTIPSGITRGRLIYQGIATVLTSPVNQFKNGSSFLGRGAAQANNDGDEWCGAASAIVSVSAGDYFSCSYNGALTHRKESWLAFEPVDAAIKGALVSKSATQAISASTTTTVTFDSETYDTDAFHDNVTNNSRLTVPSGITLVRITAGAISDTSIPSSEQFVLTFLKNGAAARGLPAKDIEGRTRLNASSAILAVSTSDYFEMQVFTTAAETLGAGDDTWFQIEEISAARKYAVVYKSGNQTIADEVYTILELGSELADTDAFHNLASTVTITIASPGVITWTGHTFANGTPLKLTTTGALPTGLTAGTQYYVVSSAANTFSLATTVGGAAINTSGSQSGTHTATNTSRLTVPSGCTRARLSFNIKTPSAVTQLHARVLMNGTANVRGTPTYSNGTPGTDSLNGFGAWIDVTSGDYFELQFEQNSAGSMTLADDDALWFCIEAE